MPPKGKKAKKQDDDWEAEALGETPDPIAAAEAEAKAADTAKDDEELGGGLMANLKRNREKRAKKGKVVNDFVEGEDAGTDSPAPEPAQAQEANADDIFAEPVKGKGAKGKQAPAKKQEEAAAADDDDDEERGADGKVMTKKEKEKAKKEREKQRKKEQAAKKKATAPAKAAEPEKKVEKVAEKAPEPEPAAPTGKDGKKKKLPPHLAALQKQVELRKQQEEEEARLKKEQEEAEAEAARLDEEQARKEAEARERRKQKEKDKKEELRKQGLLLTKAQKEAKAKAELAKESMLAAGMKVAGLSEPADKKKPVYENKKSKGKGPSKAEEEAKRLEEAKKLAELEAAQLAKDREAARLEEERLKAEQEAAIVPSDAEDWEAAADADDDEDIKESWDADTDEEEAAKEAAKETAKEETPKEAPKTNGKPVNGTANGTAAKASQAKQEKQLPVRQAKAAADSDSDSSDDDSDSEGENQTSTQRAIAQRKAEAAARREKQREEAKAAGSKDNLRSPICCILGHVDTGKTKLLDKIRQTNVQEGEAGGITQQIGATFFPVEALQQKTAVVNKEDDFKFNIPGLLIIDTPGHESFTNLRSRGSSLCNIAILVVDIMHGLEPQTLESMRLLRDRRTPFIVALNKIDRLYGWKKIDNNGFVDSFSLQGKAVQQEFRNRLDQTKVAFAEQGFNAELFSENKSLMKNVSLVPTSAHTGEGIPDMIKLITKLTQERMTKNLMYLTEFEATVLEVKVIEGLGTTIDVVISNGILKEGDRIVLCGLNGPITTTVRALLTPAPLKELRVKSQYVHHQEVKASLGVKISANDLEQAIAGSRLLVVGPDDDEEDLEEEVMADIENLLSRVSKTGRGVSVQASTLGSLEALLEFLRVSKIPVANISIGPVYKRDVMQCGVMLEKSKEYAVMLCFDVKVDPAAQAYADEVGVKIFKADIIYHLFDNFTAHMAQLAEQRKEESKMLAVFPCVLKTVAVFNKTDPIVVGVDVTEGNLRPLTPICVVKTNPVTGVKEVISLGRVTSIERDHKQVPICKKGQPSVAVKIEGPNQPMYGRQLEESDTLYSLISRRSIDTLKEFFRSDVSNDEWALIKKMKPMFDIA